MLPDKIELLKTLPFWPDLTQAEAESVIRGSYFTTYPAGTIINSSDEECIGMMMIIRGCLRVAWISNEGREITLARLRDGDVSMLAASCVFKQLSFDPQISVDEETVVLVIGAPVCRPINESNLHFRCYAQQKTSEHLLEVVKALQQLMFTRIDRRLASYLVEEYEKSGPSVKTTHDKIAKLLGSAREVVTRMLNRFSEDGYITLKRGEIRIENIDALRRLSQ